MGNFKKILVGLLLLASFGVKGQQSMFFGLNKQSSMAWDVSVLEYVGSITSPAFYDITDIHFNSDGNVLFIAQSGRIDRYILSEAWNLSSTITQINAIGGGTHTYMYFKPDGTSIYANFYYSQQRITRLILNNAWDFNSFGGEASSSVFNYITAGDFCINASGTELWSNYGGVIREYQLSTAWDITTLSSGAEHDISLYNSIRLFVSSDERHLYVPNELSNVVYQYSIESYDLNSIAYEKSKTLSEVSTINGIYIDPSGRYLFIGDNTSNKIHKYIFQ